MIESEENELLIPPYEKLSEPMRPMWLAFWSTLLLVIVPTFISAILDKEFFYVYGAIGASAPIIDGLMVGLARFYLCGGFLVWLFVVFLIVHVYKFQIEQGYKRFFSTSFLILAALWSVFFLSIIPYLFLFGITMEDIGGG